MKSIPETHSNTKTSFFSLKFKSNSGLLKKAHKFPGQPSQEISKRANWRITRIYILQTSNPMGYEEMCMSETSSNSDDSGNLTWSDSESESS